MLLTDRQTDRQTNRKTNNKQPYWRHNILVGDKYHYILTLFFPSNHKICNLCILYTIKPLELINLKERIQWFLTNLHYMHTLVLCTCYLLINRYVLHRVSSKTGYECSHTPSKLVLTRNIWESVYSRAMKCYISVSVVHIVGNTQSVLRSVLKQDFFRL